MPSREDPALLAARPQTSPAQLWHQSGVPARELAERAGHSKPSMSLDVYTQVMPVDEVPAERFLSLLT